MNKMRLGRVDYLNCLPVYHALEENILRHNLRFYRGVPAELNARFLQGKLDLTPISSIEYARHHDRCIIIPDLSIAADGRVASILFFSRMPLTEMEGRKVCVTTSSATSAALFQVLAEHYYHTEVKMYQALPNLAEMLKEGDGALLIGDDAMLAHYKVIKEQWPVIVTDLGEEWKRFTGEPMVYALWVIRRDYAEAHPIKTGKIAKVLLESMRIGMENISTVIDRAGELVDLPREVLEDYFSIIRYDFDEKYRHALLTFFNFAYKSGLIEERVSLDIWGENE